MISLVKPLIEGDGSALSGIAVTLESELAPLAGSFGPEHNAHRHDPPFVCFVCFVVKRSIADKPRITNSFPRLSRNSIAQTMQPRDALANGENGKLKTPL